MLKCIVTVDRHHFGSLLFGQNVDTIYQVSFAINIIDGVVKSVMPVKSRHLIDDPLFEMVVCSLPYVSVTSVDSVNTLTQKTKNQLCLLSRVGISLTVSYTHLTLPTTPYV